MLITDQSINLDEFTGIKPPQDCGGTALFIGRVRDHHDGKKVRRLFYECYEPMARQQIQKIIEAVTAETGVREIRVVHRIGWLEVGEIAVVVSASGAHRKEAFEACRQAIDRVKKDVPIWKKEVYADGSDEWVICGHAHEGEPIYG